MFIMFQVVLMFIWYLRAFLIKTFCVFAFGMFMLEVDCGRRPISPHSLEEEKLVDWVSKCWEKGEILKTSDPRLRGNYIAEEMKIILWLGLMCCHNDPHERPSMRQVMQVLDDSNSRVWIRELRFHHYRTLNLMSALYLVLIQSSCMVVE